MKTLTMIVLGAVLSMGSQLEGSVDLSGDQILTAGLTDSLVGGQSSFGSGTSASVGGDALGGSSSFSECETGQSCRAMAEENNSYGCPSFYYQYGGTACWPAPCVYSCQSSATGGLCESDWWSRCTDTTLTQSPGLCGSGERGSCTYTIQILPGVNFRVCRSSGLCYGGQGPVNCGVIRTCS